MQRVDGTEKVLRACVVQSGKVIDEQRLPVHAPLTIGTGARNTFVVADSALPKSHKLFDWHAGAYELVLTESMRGRVAAGSEGQPVDFAMLKSQGLLKKKGDYYQLRLADGYRGKVIIGDLTVIFQFVVPPKQATAAVPELTRAAFWSRIDWALAGCFLAFAAVETPMVAYMHTIPLDQKEPTLETMDDRWAKLIVPERKPEDVKPTAEAGAVKKAKAEANNDKVKKNAAAEPTDEAGRAQAKAQRSAEIRKSIAGKGILAVLGSAGDGMGSGAVADVFGSGGLGGDLASAFDGIAGVGLATGAGQRSTRGSGSGEAASIGGLATSGGGAVGLGGKREERVGSVRAEAPEVDGSLDSESIARVVRSRMRMVQDCYERELKRDPSLTGKIEIEFTIGEDGAVAEARVATNKMGSDEVAQCIVSRIQRWRFPKPQGGSVTVNFPFIFAPAG